MIISRRTTHFAILLLLTSLFVLPASASTPHRISREEYINRYKEIAIAHQQRFGIPASITMAQGILESDCGNSRLARGSNNHFGIKCKDYWTGKTFTHTDDAPDECFRAYDSVEASYEDHAVFLDSSPRYDSLFRFDPTDYRSWARALKAAGYATARDYAPRLIKIIEDHNLHDLDKIAAQGGKSAVAKASPKQKSLAPESAVKGVVDPNNYTVSLNAVDGRNLYLANRTHYIIARSGDSFEAIGKSFGVKPRVLRKYNENGAEPAADAIVFIEQKQSKWRGKVRKHTVVEGETLYSISQSYAIRQSSLRSINHLPKDTNPAVGSVIKLR